ncbi:MAG TPA: Gfo/Idh/MocA family oxidoreductase [Opitutaceae bacterium]|jgi:predicted dehydrogenase
MPTPATSRGRLRTAVVGAGKIAHVHARALARLPESEFVAVCSRPSARREELAARFGVRAFDDVPSMIGAAGVEAILVCTPHPEHAPCAVPALRAGVHALVEKPLAATVADCGAMIAAAQAGGATLGTVSQRRFYPPCQRIRRALDEGRLGKPALGTAVMFGWRDEAYYRSDAWRGKWAQEGGGVLVNQAPHQLDLLLWYMGEAEEVCGHWANLNHPYIEVEDTAVASVRFRNGGLGSIVVSNSQNPAINARVSVHGRNGASVGVQTDGGAMFIAGRSAILDAPFNDIWTIPGEAHLLGQWKEEDARVFGAEDPIERYHRLQVQDFLGAAIAGRPPAVTGEDGLRTVELFCALYESSRTRAAVALPRRADGAP